MSKYDLNFRRLIVCMLPYSLRGNIVDLIEVMVRPLKRYYHQFLSFKEREETALTYNSQTPLLQKLLNDTLETSGIYITDAPYHVIDGVWENAEYKPKEIGFWEIIGKSDIGYRGFYVYVPVALSDKKQIIAALVDRYKFAGTQCEIVFFE